MSEEFSGKQRELLVAAQNASVQDFTIIRVGPNQESAETVIRIGDKRFPNTWSKEEEREYMDALDNLVERGYVTKPALVRNGVWEWRLTPNAPHIPLDA